MKFMNTNIIFRVNEELVIDIKKTVRLNPEMYMNSSHFLRVAIIRELNRKFKNKRSIK